MIKNITIILFGILFGGTLTVLIAYFYYSTYLAKPTVLITPETANYLSTIGSPTSDKIKSTDSLTFRQVPLITQSTQSSSVIQTFNLIQTNFEVITKSNNSLIYRDLLTIREKAIKTEWTGIFDLVTEIKVEIEKNLTDIAEINGEIVKLETANVSNYIDYIEKTRNLTTALTEYYSALDRILIGKIPSKEDAAFINSKVDNLSNAYWEYDTSSNDFLKNI